MKPERRNVAASGHNQLRYQDLDDLAVLVSCLATHADHSALRARARRGHLFDFAENGEHVARPRWLGPADLCTSAGDSRSERQAGLYQQLQRDRRGEPAARSQSAEQRCFRRLAIKMKRLRVELRRKRLDLGLVDRMEATRKALAHLEVLKKEGI